MFQHFGKRHHQELSIRKRQRLFTNVRGHKPALILPKGLVVCIAMTVRPSGSVHARPPDLRQQRRRGKQQVSERAAHFQTLAARVRAQNRQGHRQNHRYAPHVWPEHPIGVHSEIRVRYVLRRVLQLAQTSPNNGLDGLFDFRSVHKVLCAGALKACQTPANRSTWISTASIARAEHDSTAIPVADRMALYLFSVPSVLLVSAPSVLSLIFSALCTKPAFGHAFPDSGIQKTRYLTRTPPMHAKKSLDIRYTDMIVSAMLSRQIISQYPPRQSNPFLIRQLQPLCPLFSSPAFCFQQLAASFSKTPGVGVPLRDGRCTEAQKCPSVSPLPATLTHSLSRKSFPCHSYANTRDRGVTAPPKSSSPLATRHSPLPLTPFRINTCKSVSKQRTLTTFRMNTYEKQGEGGTHGGVRTGHIPDRIDREHP